jgi:hypothetical protein
MCSASSCVDLHTQQLEAAAAAALTVNALGCASLACRRGDERGGGGGGNEPRSFKRFLMEDVPDNVSPAEAQLLYEQYLTAHFGDQLRARFEQEKTLDRCALHSAAQCLQWPTRLLGSDRLCSWQALAAVAGICAVSWCLCSLLRGSFLAISKHPVC